MKNLLLNDRVILILVLLNSFAIVLQGQFQDGSLIQFITHIDTVFSLVFTAEAIVKIRTHTFKSYITNGWNKLDFTLVVLATPAVIADLFSASDLGLSYILALRALRVLKIVRFFKFVPNIEHLFSGIQNALKSSVVVFLGFFVYVFVIGILANALFENASIEHFGTPVTAFYTVFKLFTIEGWYEIPDSINPELTILSYASIRLFFSLVVLSGGVLGLSLVNSIFVDSMLSDNNSELEQKIETLTQKVDRLLDKLEKEN